jgi:hypothetical protein
LRKIKLVRKVLPYLLIGISTCLYGCGFYYLWRKLSSERSSESFEDMQAAWSNWKTQAEMTLGTVIDRAKSSLGRLDREGRKKALQDPQQEPPEGEPEVDDQGKLNAMLARKVYGHG